ncbi:hypothetical protein RR48_01379 [Papilio machaon]|uniref:Uncharacterized protein n=1 Tax=Papilio machaon TaxID=76193 RepID=A0A0N1IIV6_PAPMA|nr:hypothetical protein RR48_01379 [Papilio machaon]
MLSGHTSWNFVQLDWITAGESQVTGSSTAPCHCFSRSVELSSDLDWTHNKFNPLNSKSQ